MKRIIEFIILAAATVTPHGAILADWSTHTVSRDGIRWQATEILRQGVRTGTTTDNFKYTIERDASGDVTLSSDPNAPNWHYSCPLDLMTDKRHCTITNGYYGIAIGLSGAIPSMLCLGAHDFPGMRGMIRIDREKPIVTDERGCVLWTRISNLTKAQTLTIRYYKFPHDSPEESKEDLRGLRNVISLTAFVYGNIDKLSF